MYSAQSCKCDRESVLKLCKDVRKTRARIIGNCETIDCTAMQRNRSVEEQCRSLGQLLERGDPRNSCFAGDLFRLNKLISGNLHQFVTIEKPYAGSEFAEFCQILSDAHNRLKRYRKERLEYVLGYYTAFRPTMLPEGHDLLNDPAEQPAARPPMRPYVPVGFAQLLGLDRR